MKRDLAKMAETKLDVLFIGGGVTGAAAAHDAALRGLRVGLVEKRDFGWATSAATSKLVHGGLRYLKNLEIGLVRESLRERRILENIAPHMVTPAPFLVPTTKHGGNRFSIISAGMVMYDMLSFDKGWLDDEMRRLPHFKLLTRRQVLNLEPGVDPRNLTGGAIYYDCQMHFPERLTLEFVLGAAQAGAQVANYAEVQELLVETDRVTGAKVLDTLTGKEYVIRAKMAVNVAGPWADFVSGLALGAAHKNLIRSQGIHLIFRKVMDKYAIVLRTRGGRHFFLIPWRGRTLAGTTDTKYEGPPDAYGVTHAAAQHFLTEINEVFPSAAVTLDEVTWTYGGLRPIVEKETEVELNTYDASRKYEIYDHAQEDHLQGFVTVIGGKYTTSRNLAEQLVDLVLDKMGKSRIACLTARTPLPGGKFRRWPDFIAAGLQKYHHVSMEMIEQLSADYGSRREKVIELMADPELAQPLDERYPIPAAAAALAVDEEMALTLEDVLWRRTALGTTGELAEEAVNQTARLMAARLGWNKKCVDEEAAKALDRLARRNMID